MSKGLLIVVSGPSGTGKGTVCSELLSQAQDLAYSISATTRQPRAGEVDGKNYYFMDKADFEKKIAEGGFLEYANVYGNYYGTPLGKIEERLAEGVDILLEIDTQGALSVMENAPMGSLSSLCPRLWQSWSAASAAVVPRRRNPCRSAWVLPARKSKMAKNTAMWWSMIR